MSFSWHFAVLSSFPNSFLREWLFCSSLPWSEVLEVIVDESTGHEKEPHLRRQLFVTTPRVIEHPVRASGDEDEESYRELASNRIVLQIPSGKNHYPGREKGSDDEQ